MGSIQARCGDLAASEAKVVELLLADPLFVGASTTAQVAARAGVSPPTVVRATRALGFTGFTELKIEIARARGTTQFFAPPEVLAVDAPLRDRARNIHPRRHRCADRARGRRRAFRAR
ncbi:MurR/RpiR family transcriptional regulator [Hydrogenophaga sp. UC242_53]|uniref:MurR/RpiR family transcriptional regulator n=1 Tax=Hydrogenophaga sp. UC242_53 TaxID=3350170 RepID=UPI0036D31425